MSAAMAAAEQAIESSLLASHAPQHSSVATLGDSTARVRLDSPRDVHSTASSEDAGSASPAPPVSASTSPIAPPAPPATPAPQATPRPKTASHRKPPKRISNVVEQYLYDVLHLDMEHLIAYTAALERVGIEPAKEHATLRLDTESNSKKLSYPSAAALAAHLERLGRLLAGSEGDEAAWAASAVLRRPPAPRAPRVSAPPPAHQLAAHQPVSARSPPRSVALPSSSQSRPTSARATLSASPVAAPAEATAAAAEPSLAASASLAPSPKRSPQSPRAPTPHHPPHHASHSPRHRRLLDARLDERLQTVVFASPTNAPDASSPGQPSPLLSPEAVRAFYSDQADAEARSSASEAHAMDVMRISVVSPRAESAEPSWKRHIVPKPRRDPLIDGCYSLLMGKMATWSLGEAPRSQYVV